MGWSQNIFFKRGLVNVNKLIRAFIKMKFKLQELSRELGASVEVTRSVHIRAFVLMALWTVEILPWSMFQTHFRTMSLNCTLKSCFLYQNYLYDQFLMTTKEKSNSIHSQTCSFIFKGVWSRTRLRKFHLELLHHTNAWEGCKKQFMMNVEFEFCRLISSNWYMYGMIQIFTGTWATT